MNRFFQIGYREVKLDDNGCPIWHCISGKDWCNLKEIIRDGCEEGLLRGQCRRRNPDQASRRGSSMSSWESWSQRFTDQDQHPEYDGRLRESLKTLELDACLTMSCFIGHPDRDAFVGNHVFDYFILRRKKSSRIMLRRITEWSLNT